MAGFLKRLIDNAPIVGPAVSDANQLIHGQAPSLHDFLAINPVFQGVQLGIQAEQGIRHMGRSNIPESAGYNGTGTGATSTTTTATAAPQTQTQGPLAGPPIQGKSSSTAGDPRPGTQWDTGAEYAAVSRMKKSDYDTAFKGSATDINNRATTFVLKALQDANITIDPNIAQALHANIGPMVAQWYNEYTGSHGGPPDVTAYYHFITQATLLAQQEAGGNVTSTTADVNPGKVDYGTLHAATVASPSGPIVGLQSVPFADTLATVAQQQNYGTRQLEGTDDPNKSHIDPTTAGAFFDQGQGGYYDLPGPVRDGYRKWYIGWVFDNQGKTVDGKPADLSPAAWEKVNGVNDMIKFEQLQKGQ